MKAAIAGLGLALVAFVASSLGEFRQFESGMAEVFSILPGISQEAMGAMQEDVLAFSQEVGRTSDQVVPALYQALSSGVPPDNVFDFMKIASDAALGGVTDLETAVDGISSAVNAYGAEVLSAQEASDLMFTATVGGKTTFEELSQSLYNVIPTAASLGLEFGNVTAALAAITAQGTPTTVATTQLRQLLVELSKAGGDAAETFERMAGQSFVDFVAEGGNLQEALVLMEQAAADSGVRLSDMFGSIEAGNAALSLTGAGAEKFAAELDAAADSAGATGDAAAIMADTGQQAINQLNAAFETLKITIGQQLAPVVTDFTQKATEQLNLMTSTTRLNEMVTKLKGMGLSMDEINEIVGDGAAQFDLWRTAADMEDDLARNEAGMRRMQWAAEGLSMGLENQRTVILEGGSAFRLTTNDLDEYVAEQEELYEINRQNAQYDEILTRGTYNLREATIAATVATDGWMAGLTAATAATEAQTVALDSRTQQMALAASGEREMTFTTQANVTAGQLAAETNRELAESTREAAAAFAGYFVEATQANEAIVTTTVDQDGLNAAMYDAAIAAGGSAEQLAILGLATGQLSEDQAEAALKTAILMAQVNNLAAAYVAGDVSISELRAEMANLVADVNAMDVEIGASTGEVNIFSGAVAVAGDELVTAADRARGFRDAADEAAGTYEIAFNITQNGEIPATPGYQGSSGAGNLGPPDGYASGGFTGYGPLDQIAGFVHRGEFVLPPEVVNSLGLPFLERLRASAGGIFDPAEMATDRANYTAGRMQPVTNNNTNRSTTLNQTVNVASERVAGYVVGSFRRLQRMNKIR